MEARLHKLYDISDCNAPKCDLWRGICARQVPLFDAAARAGWGEIDLLAVSIDGHPIVIELKLYKARNAEPPQRPLFEGTAYAVALKESWSSFWPEWDGLLSDIEFTDQAVCNSPRVDVVLLAPDAFWDHWLKQTFFMEAQKSYRCLVEEFANQGVNLEIAGIKLLEDGTPIEVHRRRDFLGYSD
jgi:hypothetical protein